ncbi:hypothetical protein Sste5346_006691 [Sporothrix stenoceras]|uniref:Geranylgeranyl pyrophosphate synthetase n=1 Tax=Sporothrix stenoceras TaxID=5173 RepID=A0ABR3YXE6_9PEZI
MASSSEPTVIAEISRLDLETLDTPTTATISNAQHLASYSWLDVAEPTIAIPGSPARWSPPSRPQRVKKDSGLLYIAQNAARHPDSPLEPLFRALYTEKPSFDIKDVDVVTDRNNLRKLLSFVNPTSTTYGIEPFTIEVEVLGKSTAVFCRSETATTEFVGPNDFHGYGHEFEKAYTTDTTPGSTGHHRIITYKFGGLNFIVRYETDAYVADTAASTTAHTGKTTTTDSDDLSGLLSSLSLKQHSTPPAKDATTIPGSKLRVTKQGEPVTQESTLEIKTRVAHRRLDFNGVAPQLWFSQTPKLVRAYHKGGIFQVPSVEDVLSEVKKWEAANQQHLRKLAALIGRILQVVKAHGGRATIRCEKGQEHKLKVYSDDASGKKMLPEDL